MKRLLLLAALLASAPASAQTVGPRDNCVDLDATTPVINGLALTSSRSFSLDRENNSGAYSLMTVWVTLVDANTSITRLDVTCTGSLNGNSSDSTPKTCVDSSGTITCSSTGVWPFSSPGSASWHWPIDIAGVPDVECTFAVGAGSAAAGDLLTVRRRLCVW